MNVSLTLVLIVSILSLDVLILITIKYMVLMTNIIKGLCDNPESGHETILQTYTSKPNLIDLKSKVKGSNVIYFNSYCKIK